MTFGAWAESECVRRRLVVPTGDPGVGETVAELRELEDDMAVFMLPKIGGELA